MTSRTSLPCRMVTDGREDGDVVVLTEVEDAGQNGLRRDVASEANETNLSEPLLWGGLLLLKG
jgi:hypothetical protein